MPNVASVLKQEISRLARKEARIMVRPLRKLAAQLRRDAAALKRRLKAQDRALSQLRSNAARQARALAEKAGKPVPVAFGEKWRKDTVRSTRRRLRLTQGQFARRLGVSLGSVNGWETGRTVPRERQKAAILELRNADRAAVAPPPQQQERRRGRRLSGRPGRSTKTSVRRRRGSRRAGRAAR